ncbi:MAG: metal-dependent transcriptional regulator [Ruminococcus sp.]|nr:metal-dependent transcriptional regulator [Candidatus Copronaster equi]
MGLQESGEMYLETILILSEKNGFVRSIDISKHMGYSKPSVSRAVGLLKNGDFISVDDEGYISLTQAGRETAQKIYERHTLLTQILVKLGVDEQTAVEDACKMEHVISDNSYNALKKYFAEQWF